MDLNNKVVQTLADSIIDTIILGEKHLPFDRTLQGIIKEVKNNNYRVEICGSYYNIQDNDSYVVGDKVWVTIPCNDYDNMFILKKRSG